MEVEGESSAAQKEKRTAIETEFIILENTYNTMNIMLVYI